MAKLVNNLVFTALVSVGLETFAFADELGMDRVALAQVLASGSGGSRAAAILAGSGFDLSGLRQAAGNLHKDVGIMLDVARAGHASEPASLVELAQRTLATLGGGADLAHPEASAPSPARSRFASGTAVAGVVPLPQVRRLSRVGPGTAPERSLSQARPRASSTRCFHTMANPRTAT